MHASIAGQIPIERYNLLATRIIGAEMAERLHRIGDDLLDRLVVVSIDLRSASIGRRSAAFDTFSRLVSCVDLFRLEVEDLTPSKRHLDRMLAKLNAKVSSIKSTHAYRVADWFSTMAFRWYVQSPKVC